MAAQTDDSKPAKAPPKRIRTYDPNLKTQEDGSLANQSFELMAIMLAEDEEIPGIQAWKKIKGVAGDPSYRRRVFESPQFKERLEWLMAEQTKCYEDPVFGQAAWQIAQLYRTAICLFDVQMMAKAAEMSLKLAQARAKSMADAEEPETPETGAKTPDKGSKVGKPTAQSPQSKQNISEIRRKMERMGSEEPAEEEEAAVL